MHHEPYGSFMGGSAGYGNAAQAPLGIALHSHGVCENLIKITRVLSREAARIILSVSRAGPSECLLYDRHHNE